jgi:hypothetical protein
MASAINTRPATRLTGCLRRHGLASGMREALVGSGGGQSEAEDETGNGNGDQEFAHGNVSPSERVDFAAPVRAGT